MTEAQAITAETQALAVRRQRLALDKFPSLEKRRLGQCLPIVVVVAVILALRGSSAAATAPTIAAAVAVVDIAMVVAAAVTPGRVFVSLTAGAGDLMSTAATAGLDSVPLGGGLVGGQGVGGGGGASGADWVRVVVEDDQSVFFGAGETAESRVHDKRMGQLQQIVLVVAVLGIDFALEFLDGLRNRAGVLWIFRLVIAHPITAKRFIQ